MMYIDAPILAAGSAIVNATVPSGASYPENPTVGSLFFLTVFHELHVYTGEEYGWVEVGDVGLGRHTTNAHIHLTEDQHQKLSDLTATATELNTVAGVTLPIQTQLNDGRSAHVAHTLDSSVHLNHRERALLSGLNLPTLKAADLNFVSGVTAPIQTQLNEIVRQNTIQNARLVDIESTSLPLFRSEINEHAENIERHVSGSQREILQSAVQMNINGDDIAKLEGLRDITGSVSSNLSKISSTRVNKAGDSMGGNLSMGGHRLTDVGRPLKPSDAATVEYVDAIAQGIVWKKEARVGTTENIVTKGLQTIDGVLLKTSDRVLVKDQTVKSQNGIWLAASGDWSRAPDANSLEKLTNAAVFITGGDTQAGFAFVQSAGLTAMNVSSVIFSQFAANGQIAANIKSLQTQIDELRALISKG